MDIRISVRNLVEFILRSGDLDNRRSGSSPNAMQEGSRIHRMIQKKMGTSYRAEVSLKYIHETENYRLIVEGRADGIYSEDGITVIDEIKGTYRELSKIKEAVPVHLAQAKCYAYMYARDGQEERIGIRMTYCNLDTEDVLYFHHEYTYEELEHWFFEVLAQYQKFTDYQVEWRQVRQKSIKQLDFPFEYRKGQKQLVTYVYQTIYHKKKLFLEAPTGVGKTISTVFPAVKALGEGKAEMIFYLTAKTITRTVAENTFSIMRKNGLALKNVTLTAKEKICPMEEAVCNPDHCPYAKGHFDRINEALYDCITSEIYFDRAIIEKYSQKYQVCPFEMGLDISLFSDAVICDYNYVFDPHVYLKRFFGDNVSGEYIFLIDEAHNLVDRGREMYSAQLRKEDFLALKRIVKTASPKMEKQLESCNKALLELKRECNGYRYLDSIAPFLNLLTKVHATMELYLEDHLEGEIHDAVLDFYFEVSHFLEIYERVDRNYVTYSVLDENEDFWVRFFCVNPANNLSECMEKAVSTILFSATLLPIQYYKSLLGGTGEDYEVYAESDFDIEKRRLLIANDVTSKYNRRSEMEFYKISEHIHRIVEAKSGNYMVFCPSYALMQKILQVFEEYFGDENMECICQSNHMNEQEREDFLKRFETGNMKDSASGIDTLIGFCVMGGIFSEGIDLKNDSLIGAVIVGTGLPQVCTEREIIMNFFEENGENGFDYAYRYPGMNKVLQAAGRVIRTKEDVGVIALLDERFLQSSYQQLFPREWKEYQVSDSKHVGMIVSEFWNNIS